MLGIWIPRTRKYDDHVAIAASILLSGGTFQPLCEAMKIVNVKMLENNTFYRIQKSLLFPAINNIYQRKMQAIFERTKEENNVCLVGDGRCDYHRIQCYFRDLHPHERNKQRNPQFFYQPRTERRKFPKYGKIWPEISSRLFGIERFEYNYGPAHTNPNFIKERMAKHLPSIQHLAPLQKYAKKLWKLAKKKPSKELQPWIKAIINHFWWSCSNCGESMEKLLLFTLILLKLNFNHHIFVN